MGEKTIIDVAKEAGVSKSTITTCKNPDVAFQEEIVLTDRGRGWWPRFFEVPSWEAPIEMYGKTGKAALEIVHTIYEADNYFVMPQQFATMRDEMKGAKSDAIEGENSRSSSWSGFGRCLGCASR